jgi:hypothetical protein
MPVPILDQVQVLNQQVTRRERSPSSARTSSSTQINLAALGGAAWTPGTIGAVGTAIRERCGIHWKASRAHIGAALNPHNPLVLIPRLKFSIVRII